jgi:hypothetical protein
VNEIFLALSTISGKAKDSIMVTTRAQIYPDLDTDNNGLDLSHPRRLLRLVNTTCS